MAVCGLCSNLDIKDKKEGVNGGAKYYCELKGIYVSADEEGCQDNFKQDEKRKQEEIAKVIDDGKKFDNSKVSPIFLLIAIIILFVLGLILKIFPFQN